MNISLVKIVLDGKELNDPDYMIKFNRVIGGLRELCDDHPHITTTAVIDRADFTGVKEVLIEFTDFVKENND